MLRIPALSFLSRTVRQASRLTPVPFCKPLCSIPGSPINKQLQQWQTWKRQMNMMDAGRAYIQPPCPEPGHVPSNMEEYTLDDLKRQKWHNEIKSPRISKELRTLLDRYSADPKAQDWANRNYDPLNVDEDSPLYAYLRSVIDSDNFMNQIYDIDFVDNANPAYGDLQRALAFHMDPAELASILEALRLGLALTDEQMELLRNFLRALAQLSPDQLMQYLEMLQRMGLLAPELLQILLRLLAQKHLGIEREKLSMLLNALKILAQRAMDAKERIAAANRARAAYRRASMDRNRLLALGRQARETFQFEAMQRMSKGRIARPAKRAANSTAKGWSNRLGSRLGSIDSGLGPFGTKSLGRHFMRGSYDLEQEGSFMDNYDGIMQSFIDRKNREFAASGNLQRRKPYSKRMLELFGVEQDSIKGRRKKDPIDYVDVVMKKKVIKSPQPARPKLITFEYDPTVHKIEAKAEKPAYFMPMVTPKKSVSDRRSELSRSSHRRRTFSVNRQRHR